MLFQRKNDAGVGSFGRSMPRAALAAVGVVTLSLLAGCSGGSGSEGGEGGSDSLIVVGYGGLTETAMKDIVFPAYAEDTGADTTWVVAPGGIAAGVSAQQESGNPQWDMGFALTGGEVATLYSLGYVVDPPKDVKEAIEAAGGSFVGAAVPERVGASMIVCNMNVVDKCPTNAKEFFDVEAFPGHRTFSSFQPLTALAFAQESLGTELEDDWSNMDFDAASGALDKLKPSIRTFYSSSDEANTLLANGEIGMALYWNSYVGPLVDSGDGYEASWENAVEFYTYNAVFKEGPNGEAAAWDFLIWLNQNPAVIFEQLQFENGGIPSNTNALEFLDEDAVKWAPGVPPRDNLAVENDAWYLSNRDAVDAWWASLTS